MLINRQSVSATRFLTVDAYLSVVPFYEKNGFRPLLNTPCEDTLPMYFDLMQLIGDNLRVDGGGLVVAVDGSRTVRKNYHLGTNLLFKRYYIISISMQYYRYLSEK